MTDASAFTAAYLTHALGRALIMIAGLSVEQVTAIARIIGVDAPEGEPCRSACCASGPLTSSLFDTPPASYGEDLELRSAAEALMDDIRNQGIEQPDGSVILPGRLPAVVHPVSDVRGRSEGLAEAIATAGGEQHPASVVTMRADVLADLAIAHISQAGPPAAADFGQLPLVREIIANATRTGALPPAVRPYAFDIAKAIVAHMERTPAGPAGSAHGPADWRDQ